MFTEKVKCNVAWYCRKLKKEIIVSKKSVYNQDYGWLCDCGSWVTNGDSDHTILRFGFRSGFIEKKD
jgi:hypothetical protein